MAGVYYHQGNWTDEPPKVLGPTDHAFWLGSVVFDGARAIAGMIPDLDLHCKRLIDSARKMGMNPDLTATQVTDLCIEGIRRMPADAVLYIRPMYFAREGWISPDPDSAEFILAMYEAPLPDDSVGFSACFTGHRRPARESAPTDAKASALYPNAGRAMAAAAARGFDNAVFMDPNGNVAEFATANLWMVRDGVATTPAINGTFLNGITRQRVIQLLRDDGVEVVEGIVTRDDLMQADEIFSTGNHAKVLPVIRLEDRDLQPGPVTKRARELYFAYAENHRVT